MTAVKTVIIQKVLVFVRNNDIVFTYIYQNNIRMCQNYKIYQKNTKIERKNKDATLQLDKILARTISSVRVESKSIKPHTV